jgi:CRP/FNR family transcriptional regulator, cyclic AMP receptor protein
MSSKMRGKLLEEHIEENNRVGLVEFGGKRRTIYLDLVPDAHTGDYVWFHSAFATEVASGADEGYADSQQSTTSDENLDHEPELSQYRAYRLLGEIEPEHLRKLLPLTQDKDYPAGEVIFQVGDNSLFLHLIVAGEVSLEDEAGRHVQTLRAGDAMGWSALTPAAKTHFQARALTRVLTVAFPGDQLRAACKRDPSMGYELMVHLLVVVTERLDVLRKKLQA